MAWLLSRHVLRCQRRRVVSALRAWPLAGALAPVLVAASPLVAWRAGRALGSLLQPVLDDAGLATLVVLGPISAGAAAGAVLCLTSPGNRALGSQLAALPVGARSLLVATVVVPAFAAAALALPAALAFAVAFGAESPGGPTAGVALVAGTLVGAATGAAVAESVLHAAAGERRRGVSGALAAAAAWGAAGWLQQEPLAGPLALAGAALSGRGNAVAALGVALAAAVLYGAAWLELAARRSERVTPGRVARHRRRPGPAVPALPAAAMLLLGRRRDVRLALLAGVGLGLAGVALAQRSRVPAPGPLHLGVGSTLLAAAFAPLVVGGLLTTGRWAWACAPRGRLLLCSVFVAAAQLAALVALTPVLTAAALVSEAPARAVGEVVLVACGLAAAAALAGALVPWRGATMGDQMASFAALAACAGAFSVSIGTAGPRLAAAGIPDAAAAVALLAACTCVSLAAIVRRLCAQDGAV